MLQAPSKRKGTAQEADDKKTELTLPSEGSEQKRMQKKPTMVSKLKPDNGKMVNSHNISSEMSDSNGTSTKHARTKTSIMFNSGAKNPFE